MSTTSIERPLVEICAPSVERAREAFALGADRVELCRDIDCGGVTPTEDDLRQIPSLGGPVHVLIRCRAGNFVYTDEELQRLSVARKYQLAQQCLYLASAKPKEARELVTRLGPEFLAWFEYVLSRKK